MVFLGAAALGTAFAIWVGVAATSYYVDDATCPATGSGTLGDPFCRIQDAICAAASGDTVSVAPGSYPESLRMKPGVSLISQGGPSVTTIDASGKPCTETDYCTKRTGTQCSAVIFPAGHSLSTVLEGFTITGGAGAILTDQIAGGGIYVYSSPTIANNVITNNFLAGARAKYQGAGIFVGVGEPLITGNVISGNRAVPPAGGTKSPTQGYGGGVYVGFFTRPDLIDNVITNNVAGDPNVAYSIGGGGGIAIFPGSGNRRGSLIDRNLIADNSTDTLGGGIHILGLVGTEMWPILTNNVIVGNTGHSGGGIYTAYAQADTINNTITDNSSQLGGGLHIGGAQGNLSVTVTNNIIVGNRLPGFGTNGGGIYTYAADPNFHPVIRYNDLWGNDKNQVAGDETDATIIGFNGNFSADPLFVDPNARDFTLDGNSPAIDAALASEAPAYDFDNTPRPIDGTGVPDDPEVGDFDVGAFEYGACLLNPELCDGLDNNCNSLIDEGFPNTDGDAMADCVDPDDDDDGILDASDCAPLDAGAFGVPGEVTNVVALAGAPTTITYDVQNVGTGTAYEIVSGLIGRLTFTGGLGEDFCVEPASTGGFWQDTRPDPPPGDGWFYMIRGVNTCGASTFGNPLRDQPRPSTVCPSGIVDGDSDGSPSDLDCNDNDANNSPVNQEICDGLDNNCDTVADEGNPGGGTGCPTGLPGVCGSGTTDCQGGALVCVATVQPSAEVCDNLDNDCDGTTDSYATTCGAGQCFSTGTCTAGVDTCVPGTPTPEVCDGLDNNCNTLTDEGFLNTDGDSMADCVDPDDDNDGALDASDCAPLNPTAFGVPTEVQDLEVLETAPTQLTWLDQTIGLGTVYDVASGAIVLSGTINFGSGICLTSVTGSPAVDSRPDPPPNTAWYYLVKSRNACGAGTYGSPGRDALPACP